MKTKRVDYRVDIKLTDGSWHFLSTRPMKTEASARRWIKLNVVKDMTNQLSIVRVTTTEEREVIR